MNDNINNKLLLCYRPFSEIRFNPDGSICSCCLQYREQGESFKLKSSDLTDLQSIFHLPWMEELRADIDNNKIPKACSICASWKKNIFPLLSHYPKRGGIETQNLPSLIRISNFRQCNLSCKMCSDLRSTSNVLKEPEDKTFQKDICEKTNTWIADRINIGEIKNSSIVLCGGEPLLDTTIKCIYDAIEANPKLNNRIHITTNAVLDTEEAHARMKIINSVSGSVTVSFDGDNRIHTYIRNYSGEKTAAHVKRLMAEYNSCSYQVATTISALNAGYLYEMYRWIRGHFKDIYIGTSYCGNMGLDVLPFGILKLYRYKINFHLKSILCGGESGGFGVYKPAKRAIQPESVERYIGKLLQENDYKLKWDKFKKTITKFDAVAGTNVLDIYPEFKEFWND